MRDEVRQATANRQDPFHCGHLQSPDGKRLPRTCAQGLVANADLARLDWRELAQTRRSALAEGRAAVRGRPRLRSACRALLDRQRIRSARDLRIACFIIPLPFGTAFFREARTRPLAAFAVGAILGLVATCAMTISVSLRYHQPILPSDTFEWLENVEYVVSIAVGFFTGNILARMPGVASWWPQKEDWV